MNYEEHEEMLIAVIGAVTAIGRASIAIAAGASLFAVVALAFGVVGG